jgi:hypothetical protein
MSADAAASMERFSAASPDAFCPVCNPRDLLRSSAGGGWMDSTMIWFVVIALMIPGGGGWCGRGRLF